MVLNIFFHTQISEPLYSLLKCLKLEKLFITGVLRRLIELPKPIELWICRPDPELRVLPNEPHVDPDTKRVY